MSALTSGSEHKTHVGSCSVPQRLEQYADDTSKNGWRIPQLRWTENVKAENEESTGLSEAPDEVIMIEIDVGAGASRSLTYLCRVRLSSAPCVVDSCEVVADWFLDLRI